LETCPSARRPDHDTTPSSVCDQPVATHYRSFGVLVFGRRLAVGARPRLPLRVNRYRNGLSELCPLSPRKRPNCGHRGMSQTCHKPTYAAQPVGWVERSDTHQVVASPCWRARMTDHRRDLIVRGFFFERPQQGDGFRKCSTHPTGCRCPVLP
jgi:hypothetical protein